MCSLVEIKNPNEIYIHYLFDDDPNANVTNDISDKTVENTSDRGDSIDSVDNNGNVGDVTVNDNSLTVSTDVAVQVDLEKRQPAEGSEIDQRAEKKQDKATMKTMGKQIKKNTKCLAFSCNFFMRNESVTLIFVSVICGWIMVSLPS